MVELRINRSTIFSLMAVVILGLISFNYYNTNSLENQLTAMSIKLQQAENDYNEKIDYLQSTLNSNIQNLDKNIKSIDSKTESLKEDVKETKSATEQKLGNIETTIQTQQEASEKKIEGLQGKIAEVEEQSDEQLTELRTQLQDIDVSADFTDIVADVIDSVVSVIAGSVQGSGAIISDDGYIVTNYHVVNGAPSLKILTYEGQLYDASFVGAETNTDLAVLKINAGTMQKLEFGNSNNVKVGEKVIALGNPAGFDFSVTEGIVSAVHRMGPNGLRIYTQTDVPVNPGNSGGPLVNKEGKIIGINNFKITGFESLAFAIESNTVSDVVNQIINS